MGGTVESDGLVIPDQGAAEHDTTRCEIVLGLLARTESRGVVGLAVHR